MSSAALTFERRRPTFRCVATQLRGPSFSRGRLSIAKRELEQRANDLFNWMAAGKMRLRIDFEFPLKDAITAHQALEGPKTTGEVLFIP